MSSYIEALNVVDGLIRDTAQLMRPAGAMAPTANTSHHARLRILLASLPKYDDSSPVELGGVVCRILNDMKATVWTPAEYWGDWYPRVFQRPLPYNTCNPDREELMLELLPFVGEAPLHTSRHKRNGLQSLLAAHCLLLRSS
jgi:hypothetical protein